MNVYTLTPLSGSTGKQTVIGFRDAISVARDIAMRERAHVVVRNAADCHTWNVAFRVRNSRMGARFSVEVTR